MSSFPRRPLLWIGTLAWLAMFDDDSEARSIQNCEMLKASVIQQASRCRKTSRDCEREKAHCECWRKSQKFPSNCIQAFWHPTQFEIKNPVLVIAFVTVELSRIHTSLNSAWKWAQSRFGHLKEPFVVLDEAEVWAWQRGIYPEFWTIP